ncbi:hypothetical protein B0T13DRAFT_482013 [Neurospora crassa]|nr:hypothetical protein B0T13DRAFT_482013 [Neurospora crassa]
MKVPASTRNFRQGLKILSGVLGLAWSGLLGCHCPPSTFSPAPPAFRKAAAGMATLRFGFGADGSEYHGKQARAGWGEVGIELPLSGTCLFWRREIIVPFLAFLSSHVHIVTCYGRKKRGGEERKGPVIGILHSCSAVWRLERERACAAQLTVIYDLSISF